MDTSSIGLITLLALQGIPAGGHKDRALASCVVSRPLERTVAADGDAIRFIAAAARLTVTGAAEARDVTLEGRICAASEALLAAAGVEAGRDAGGGLTLTLRGTAPETAGADESPVLFIVRARVPPSAAVNIDNGWGRTAVAGVSAVTVDMDRGDARLDAIAGPATVRLGRGDVEATGVEGDLEVTRRLGEVIIDGVGGSVTLATTGIGETQLRNVTGDVHVREDGPGDLIFEGIGGDLTVENDPRGDVRYTDVEGSIRVPEKEKGPPRKGRRRPSSAIEEGGSP